MARVRAGEIQLGWREWGKGDVTVVFIHGNLASKDWIGPAAPLFRQPVNKGAAAGGYARLAAVDAVVDNL